MRTEDKGQRTKARTFDFRTLAKLVFVCCPLSYVLNAAGPKETVSATIKVGEPTELYSFTYKTPAEDRWWKLVVNGTADGSSSAQFEDPLDGKSYRSAEHSTEARFSFIGVKPGKQTWRIYWTSPSGNLTPEDNPDKVDDYAYEGNKTDRWASKDDYYVLYEITVTSDDPPPEPGAAAFAITPYLQRPAADAMTIVFFTDSACTATVEAWPANAAGTPRLQETTTGVWAEALTNNVNCGESSVWNNSLYKHSVRLTGLEANRSYEYTVTLAGGVSYSNTFRTAPSRNTPIRFVSYADCETEKSPWSNYVKNLKRMKDRQPDFFALSGDYAARGGRQEHWDGFWKANAGTETDVAGSIPILAVIGNHDLFDQGLKNHTSGYWYDMQGEPSTDRYVTYFGSELYYREDYGPVTLIFLDTNNGRDGDTDDDHDHDTNYLDREDGQHLKGGLDRRKGCRHPDFNVGTPQYDWLTNNLADAQAKSRFTFVFNHHCPYSRGAHNMDWREHEDGSALALRFLTETFVRYGVDGWYCGHDELLEHSITNGWEILPNGQRRKHTLSIYDLGCSGDTPRDSDKCTNPLEYWWNEDNYGGASGTKYGFLETDVTTNRNGQWTCTITPVQGSSGNYLNAQIVYVENPDRGEDENDLVYAEAANASHPIDGASQTKPSDWLPWTKPPEGPDPEPKRDWWIEEPVWTLATRITFAAGEQTGEQYRGFLTKKGLEYAWGKDGVAETPWKQSDGTPMEQEKPDEVQSWELMVRE